MLGHTFRENNMKIDEYVILITMQVIAVPSFINIFRRVV
jgi:hypothetical protein